MKILPRLFANSKIMPIFAGDISNITNMNVAINNNIYRQASDYAQSQGLNLSEVIENFLLRFIGKSNATSTEKEVPDVVLSLLGAGEAVAEKDLNARKAYNDYLEKKYQ